MWMRCLFTGLALGVALSLGPAPVLTQEQIRIVSPNGRNAVTVETRDGRLYYTLQRDDRAVLLASLLDPLLVTTSQQNVTATSRVRLQLAPGGGQAIRIRPAL